MISLVFMGILVWMFWGDRSKIWDILKDVNPCDFFTAVLMNILALVIVSYRLKIILAVQGLKLTIVESSYLTFIGMFFNNFLPTSIGGDLVKAYYATKKSEKKLESFSAVFFDRFFGFLSIGLLAFFGLLFMNGKIGDPKLMWGCATFAGAVFLIFMLFLNKNLAKGLFSGVLDMSIFRKGSKLRKLYNALNTYKEHPVVVVKVVGISLMAQVVSVVSLYFIIKSLSQEISFLNLFLIMPLVSVASMIPSINGLGVREGAFVMFLSEFISKGSSAAVSILFLATVLLTSLMGGIVYLFSDKLYKIPKVG